MESEAGKSAKHHAKQVNLLSELIDRKIEARVSGLESTVTKMFRLFKKMKSYSAPKKMAELEAELKSVKEVLEDLNVKGLEEDVFRKLGEISKKLSHSIEGQSKVIEDLDIEVSSMKKSLEDFQVFDKEMDELDISEFKRELESLKTKSEWIELELEKLDIRPLLERLEELEARMSTIRLSQPTIIE